MRWPGKAPWQAWKCASPALRLDNRHTVAQLTAAQHGHESLLRQLLQIIARNGSVKNDLAVGLLHFQAPQRRDGTLPQDLVGAGSQQQRSSHESVLLPPGNYYRRAA